MSPTYLRIDDGIPWYLSTDIWVVPGNNPEGPQGQPQAGRPAFVWARVHNTDNGSQDVKGAVVEFWWANPSLQITRSNANLIGRSVVDVDAETSMEVLCLVPWVPVTVNDGHECLVVVVIQDNKTPLLEVFNAPAHSNVAQSNLTVLPAFNGIALLTLTAAAYPRQSKHSTVSISIGEPPLTDEAIRHLQIEEMTLADPRGIRAGLARGRRRCEPDDGDWVQGLELEISAGTAVPIQLFLRSDLKTGEYQIVHVTERDESGEIGGIAVVMTNADTDKPIDK